MKKLLTLLALLCVLCTGAWGGSSPKRYDVFKSMPIDQSSIVFVGNSITHMHPWVEAFGNNPNIRNRGNSGATSSEILANVRSYCVGQPAKIFLLIGTNDGPSDSSNPNIVSNIKQTITTIRKVSPNTQIYVQSILPRVNYNTAISKCNTMLHSMIEEFNTKHAADNNLVTFVNAYDQLVGKLDAKNVGGVQYSYDGLHMTAAGYEIWTKYLEQFIGGDIHSVYPADTKSKQNNGNGGSDSWGARCTYFSMMPITSDDVLFFGDEMVHCGEWHELLGTTSVKNRGTNWAYDGTATTISRTTSEVEATFAETGVSKQAPKQVLIYTGTGEVNKSGNDITSVVEQYKVLVEKVRNKWANTKISLVSLMPTSATTAERVKSFNQQIQQYADGQTNVDYIDIYSVLSTNDNRKAEYYLDGQNINGPGYVAIANKIAENLRTNGTTCNPITPEAAADYRESLKATFTASTVGKPVAYRITSQSGNTIAQNLTIQGTAGSQGLGSGLFIFIRQSEAGKYKIYETVSHKYVALTDNASASCQSGTKLVSDANQAEVFTITNSTTDGYFLISPTSKATNGYLNYNGGLNSNSNGQTAGFYTHGNNDSGSKWSFTEGSVPSASEYFREGYYLIQVGEGHDSYKDWYINGEPNQVDKYNWAATLVEHSTNTKTYVYIKSSTQQGKFHVIYNYNTDSQYSVTSQALYQQAATTNVTFTPNEDGSEWSINAGSGYWKATVLGSKPTVGNYSNASHSYFKFTEIDDPNSIMVTYTYTLNGMKIGEEVKKETRGAAPTVEIPDYVNHNLPATVTQSEYTIATNYKYPLPFVVGKEYNLIFWPGHNYRVAYTNVPTSQNVALESFTNENNFSANEKRNNDAYIWTVEGNWFSGFTFKNNLGYFIAAPALTGLSDKETKATTESYDNVRYDLEYVTDKAQYVYKVRGGNDYLAHISDSKGVGFHDFRNHSTWYTANYINFRAVETSSESQREFAEGWYQIKVASGVDNYHNTTVKGQYICANSHVSGNYTWAMGLTTDKTKFESYVYITGNQGNYTMEFLHGTHESYFAAFDATNQKLYSTKSTSVSFIPNPNNPNEFKIRGNNSKYWKAWDLDGPSIGAASGTTADGNYFEIESVSAPTIPGENPESSITVEDAEKGKVYSIQNVATKEYAGFNSSSTDQENFRLSSDPTVNWLTKLTLFPKEKNDGTYYALRIASSNDCYVSANTDNQVFTNKYTGAGVPDTDEYLWKFVDTGNSTFAVQSKNTGKIWNGQIIDTSIQNGYTVKQEQQNSINSSLADKYKWQFRTAREEVVITPELLGPLQTKIDTLIWHTFDYQSVGYPEFSERNPELMELLSCSNYFFMDTDFQDPLDFYHFYLAEEEFEKACSSLIVNPPVDDATYKLKAKFADGSFKYVSYENKEGDTGLLILTDKSGATQWIVKPEESDDPGMTDNVEFSLIDASTGKYLYVESQDHKSDNMDKSKYDSHKAKLTIKKTMPNEGNNYGEALNSFLLGSLTIQGTTPDGHTFPLLAGSDGKLRNGSADQFFYDNDKEGSIYRSCQFFFEKVGNPNIIKVTNPRKDQDKKTHLDGLYIGTFSAPYDVDLHEIFEWKTEEEYNDQWGEYDEITTRYDYEIEVYTATVEDKTVYFHPVTLDETHHILPRNTGVVFVAPEAPANINAEAFHIIKENNANSEYVEIEEGKNDLVGSNGFSKVMTEGMYILAPRTTNGAQIEGVGFYKATPNTTLARNKAYFDFSSSTIPTVAAFNYVFDTDEMTTVIDSPLINKSQNAEIFDISGRLVNDRTTRGIFITNGKKVIR